MLHAALSERLDALIDALILDGGIEAASLASIFLTAQDSVARDDLVTLTRKVWKANDELLDEFASRHGHRGPALPRPATPAGG